MGVKHFWIWINKHFSDCIQTNDEGIQIDNLCLDVNGIIHNSAQKVYKYGNFRQNRILKQIKRFGMKYRLEFFQEICNRIEHYFLTIKPRKRLIISIDGVAGLAKMFQQRQRRYRSSEDKLDHTDFIPISLTPGTEMMDYISKYIDWFIRLKISHFPEWKDVEVIFSSEKVPGEGEAKLLSYIRKYGDEYESFCIYGADADLIMLGLSSGYDKMYVIREDMRDYDVLYYVNVGLLASKLVNMMKWNDSKTFRRKNAILDFVFMCFLVGNDFLPTIPTLGILENGIDIMLDVYKSISSHITSERNGIVKLRPKPLSQFFGTLAQYEKGMLEDKQKSRERYFPDELLNSHTKFFNKDNVVVDFDGYRKEFYDKKFSHYNSSIENEYIRGLEWVINYYKCGMPDWNWFFPHNYSPFLTDLARSAESFKSIPFTRTDSFQPFLQLLYVIPYSHRNLLPLQLQHIVEKYEWHIDLSGKRREWEGIIILPNIDTKQIRKKYEELVDKVDAKYKRRNKIQKTVRYKRCIDTPSFWKSYYGNIIDCIAETEILEL